MPLRTYRCTACGRPLEVLEGWKPMERRCSECGSTMAVVIGAPRVRFGGTWVRHSMFDDGDRGKAGDLGLFGG